MENHTEVLRAAGAIAKAVHNAGRWETARERRFGREAATGWKMSDDGRTASRESDGLSVRVPRYPLLPGEILGTVVLITPSKTLNNGRTVRTMVVRGLLGGARVEAEDAACELMEGISVGDSVWLSYTLRTFPWQGSWMNRLLLTGILPADAWETLREETGIPAVQNPWRAQTNLSPEDPDRAAARPAPDDPTPGRFLQTAPPLEYHGIRRQVAGRVRWTTDWTPDKYEKGFLKRTVVIDGVGFSVAAEQSAMEDEIPGMDNPTGQWRVVSLALYLTGGGYNQVVAERMYTLGGYLRMRKDNPRTGGTVLIR